MNTRHTQRKFVTAVGAAIAAATVPALLFIGAGTAQAIQDISEVIDPGNTSGIEDPVIRPPSIIDPGIKVHVDGSSIKIGIVDPGIKVGITDPGLRVGIGGPDTRPAH